MSSIDTRKAYEHTTIQGTWPVAPLAAFLIFLGTLLDQHRKDDPQPKQYTATTERKSIVEALAKPEQDDEEPSELPIQRQMSIQNILKTAENPKPNHTRISQETNNTEIQ